MAESLLLKLEGMNLISTTLRGVVDGPIYLLFNIAVSPLGGCRS